MPPFQPLLNDAQLLLSVWTPRLTTAGGFTPHMASDQRCSPSPNDNEASRPQQLMHLAANDD